VAQEGVMFTAGYVVAGEPDQSSWRLTLQRNLAGPIGLDFGAQVLPGSRPGSGDLYGFEVDFTLFEGTRRLPAVFFGAAAGIGVQDQDRVFYGASAGMRVPVLALGPLRVAIEGRWRTLSVDNRDGLEFGATLGWRKSRSATARPDATGLYVPRGTAERLRAAGIPEEKARLIGSVVSTAIEEMGQPYVWGGTGDGSGGFDCSGLIYYAYGRYNVRIPRTSAGQATAGIAIRREMDALLPGDILTFAENGSQVTHVGLYVGEDRFIHSASGGVRLSRLTEDDPYGRYWLRRWVGVRRVVE
jgi:cell wall-associated NlpC family hydrolase